MKKILLMVLVCIVAIVAPFILFIRSCSFFINEYDIHPFLSVAASSVLGSLLIASIIKMKVKSVKLKTLFMVTMAASSLYVGYCCFVFVDSNSKTEQVAKEHSTLHPVLRISMGFILLVDKESVVTDISREKSDYKKMGLPSAERSNHYIQDSGYVHAFDMRTNNRGYFRNATLQLYFWLCGLKTLRHVGTSDHLHVSI
jgi:hypothetical protein